MRQQKKATFCSRTCARKHQHSINHADKRVNKSCEVCKKEFVTTNWDKAKRFCSSKCAGQIRHTRPADYLEKNREKLGRMIGDSDYLHWLKIQARKFGAKFSVDSDDLLQEYFTRLLEGNTGKFEFTFYDMIKDHYSHGITGKSDPAQVIDGELIFKSIRKAKNRFDDFEFIEYLVDLKRALNDEEYKLVCMVLAGFDKCEVYEKSKNLSRRELIKFWDKIGIKDVRI